MYKWFNLVNNKWENQSGFKVALKHSLKCNDPRNVGNIKLFTHVKTPKISRLPPHLLDCWHEKIVKLITTHPTISLLSGTDIISKTADFVAKTSNDTKILFDYEVSRHTITRKILEKGKAMKTFYLNLFLNMVNDSDCAMSGIVDYWTARQTFLQPYSGIIACGLNSSWEWGFFLLSLSKLDCEIAHTAKFTYDLFLKECSFDLIKSKDPFLYAPIMHPL